MAEDIASSITDKKGNWVFYCKDWSSSSRSTFCSVHSCVQLHCRISSPIWDLYSSTTSTSPIFKMLFDLFLFLLQSRIVSFCFVHIKNNMIAFNLDNDTKSSTSCLHTVSFDPRDNCIWNTHPCISADYSSLTCTGCMNHAKWKGNIKGL